MLPKFYHIIFVLLFVVAFSGPGKAQLCLPAISGDNVISKCDYCQCSQGISPMETGSTGIRFDIGSLYLGAPYTGSARQPNPDNVNESFLTNRITLSYRISTSPFTVSLGVPYVVRKSEEPGGNGLPLQTFKADGIGDIVTTVRFNHKHYIDESMVAFSISAGAKLATGKSDLTLLSGGYLDPDLQPGTGTTDMLFGAAGFWSLDRIGVGANATVGIVTGRGAPEAGGQYHKYGNYINGEINARYRIVPAEINESNLSLTLGLGAETRAHETSGGRQIENSGGSIIYIAPGFKYIISASMSADGVVQIPIHQYLGGNGQLGQNYRILAGMQYLL